LSDINDSEDDIEADEKEEFIGADQRENDNAI